MNFQELILFSWYCIFIIIDFYIKRLYKFTFFMIKLEEKKLYISAFTQKHTTINLTWMLVWRNTILREKSYPILLKLFLIALSDFPASIDNRLFFEWTWPLIKHVFKFWEILLSLWVSSDISKWEIRMGN